MDRSRRYWFGITGVVGYVFLTACTAVAQVAAAANEEYRTPALRAKAASEMDPPMRGSLQRSGALVDSLGLHAGDTIADLGPVLAIFCPISSDRSAAAVRSSPSISIWSSLTRFANALPPRAGGTCMQCSAQSAIRSCPQTGSTGQFSSTRIITSTTRRQQCKACGGPSSPAGGFLS